MFPRTKNRKAISTVLTTLIILVASVVLGTGVVLYGTSLFQTGAQSKSISSQGVQMWVNSTDSRGVAWGAAAIRNGGDKLLSVDTIQVRGTNVPFTNWYYDNSPTDVTSSAFQSQFNYTKTDANGLLKSYVGYAHTISSLCGATFAGLAINATNTPENVLCLTQASGPISLQPGSKAIVYFHVPNGILTTVDGGSASTVAIYAGGTGAPQSVTVQSK